VREEENKKRDEERSYPSRRAMYEELKKEFDKEFNKEFGK
jgi:hypothetical protein